MWNASGASLPSVLIVQNKSGNVFIVENNSKQSQVEKILQKNLNIEKTPGSSKKKVQVKIESREPSPIPISEIKQEPEEWLDDDDYFDDKSFVLSQVPFIDPSAPYEEVTCKIEPSVEIEEIEETVEIKDVKLNTTAPPVIPPVVPQSTFDGNWSSDEDGGGDDFAGNDDFPDSDDEPLIKLKPPKSHKRKIRSEAEEKEYKQLSRDEFWSHKAVSLAGRIACKYCDTIFETKDEQVAHECKYLQCNKRNFICRVCNKELSRKTFSNHLHETLACQYCNKKFVNPRSMKTHILKQHKGKKLVAPRTYKDRREILMAVKQETENADGTKKKVYPKKILKLECDNCGKYLASRRTLKLHMNMHVDETHYICENCGEKFYTQNGLKKHNCEKKRRRYDRDFLLTHDMRYCRFCDSRFENYDQNKAHNCLFKHPTNTKKVFCRCCGKEVKKGMFNRHMETHTDIEWKCGVCDRKLITERALKIHMTTHTGNKQYTCSMCPESFISKAILERHMRFHGATPKLHRCEYCFMELSTETVLRRHIQKIHRQTAICELCKMELPSKEHLKEHLMTSHEPAVCQVCNKTFTLPRYLKMHEKLHFEDQLIRVQCSICSKTLVAKNIKAHVFRHHSEQFDSWLQAYQPV